MKLKINKACDLNSISVLPPHSRRPNVIGSGTDSSVFGKSQLRSQQQQQSQQSFSQGTSSQLSQNSLGETLTNDQRFGSQERENSGKRMSCLAPISYARGDTQMQISRYSNNAIPRWGSAAATDHKCQVSEELEHRIGLMETSLSSFGMILDSIQSNVMQVNKAVKEVSLETEGVKQKLLGQDNSLQLMLKGEEDLKASLDGSLKSIPDQLRKDLNQRKLHEAVSVISTLPDQIEARLLKLQSELGEALTKQIEATADKMKPSNDKDLIPSNLPPKRTDSWVYQPQRKQAVMDNPVGPPSVCTRRTPTPKVKMESRDSVKPEPSSFTNRQHNIKYKRGEVPLIELATADKMKPSNDKDLIPSNLPPKRDCWVYQRQRKQAVMDNPVVPPSVCTRRTLTPKVKMESRDSVKPEPSSFTNRQHNIKYQRGEVPLIELDREWRVIIESDEEIDEGFSCLLKEKERGVGNCLTDDVRGDAERILRKARRRKRKHCNQIIVI